MAHSAPSSHEIVSPPQLPCEAHRVRYALRSAGAGLLLALALGCSSSNPHDPSESEILGIGQQAAMVVNGVTTRTMAIVMLEYNGVTATTQNDLRNLAFLSTSSLDAYYNESSYGKLRFTGDVFGWYHIATPDCTNLAQIATLGQQAAANVNLASYDHVSYFIPACGLMGFGDIGKPAAPARQTWFSLPSWRTLAHEVGHNLGLQHSNGYVCGNSILSTSASCTSVEYADPFDIMGIGSTCGQLNTYERASLSWMQGCNVVTTPQTSVFNLTPLETATTGVQAVRVPANAAFCPGGISPCYYYIETRRAVGAFDGSSVYAGSNMFDGALVRMGVGIDATGTSYLSHSQVLDMNLSTPQFDSLGVGMNFSDPTGVRIKVLSQTATATRVAVKVPGGTGSATCLNGTTYALDTACNNGVLNTGETSIDCGGPNCTPCDEGRACSTNNDCWSGSCQNGACVAACNNGIKDGTETDVDCGGSCNDCVDGKSCVSAGDCLGGACTNGVCRSPLAATLNVHSTWQTGYCASIDLLNTASTPTSSWTIEMSLEASTLTSSSGAVFTATGSGIYRLTPTSTSAKIWPSSHGTISFCANKTGTNFYPAINWVSAQY